MIIQLILIRYYLIKAFTGNTKLKESTFQDTISVRCFFRRHFFLDCNPMMPRAKLIPRNDKMDIMFAKILQFLIGYNS